MKIEKKSKKSVSDLPLVTQELIRRILGNSVEEIVTEIQRVDVWRYGKCELYHWIDVLDTFDFILSTVTTGHDVQKGLFMCPKLSDPVVKSQVLAVLNFTSLLIEHSYARHIYNSTEHLCILLASPDLDIVLAVLNLLYVFGKRSNFISRLPTQQRNNLNSYLEFLGETWGGDKNGFGLAKCCQDVSIDAFPSTASSVYFEYQPNDKENELGANSTVSSYTAKSIIVHNVDQLSKTVPELMSELTQGHLIPPVQMMHLMTRIRLAKNFSQRNHRIKCILVRLQAISVLVYSMAPAEVVDPLIYDGLVEELVEVLEMKDLEIQEVRAAVLRTLTAIIHLERDPRLGVIIEVTGATTYHGFLPSLVRDCVVAITNAGPDGTTAGYPLTFATALFSFLYHLATYEASGDALVNSGVMESLLQVLEWRAVQPMNITLVTRAVRVVDLITNLDMTAFHSFGGWDKMLDRLKMEVDECREDVPGVLSSSVIPARSDSNHVPMETDATPINTSSLTDVSIQIREGDIVQCMPERSALIKSILNFLKKAIPDPTFAENIRNFVNSSLPSSLAHITSNAEYYGASIYLPATEVATTFIFHDPSQLSSLQDNGLPWIILNSLIRKKIPVTREVLSALPNILSAICLNSRGLQTFIDSEPFDHLFGVLITPEYLPAMRRKRGNETLGDTATNLGGAMDELMRHQPLLRPSVMTSLIKLLKRLCVLGSNVSTSSVKGAQDESGVIKEAGPVEEGMISEEDDDSSHLSEEEGANGGTHEGDGTSTGTSNLGKGKKRNAPLPLTEYTQNVVHFVDCILSNSSSDDHIKGFVSAGGLQPLVSLLALPALPLSFPSSPACTSVISACKAVLHTAHEGQVMDEGLSQLSHILSELESFINSPVKAKGSVLLEELSTCLVPDKSHLLHNLTAAGSYIQMFIQLAKFPPGESRQICVKKWASPQGQRVLDQLSALYRSLVWEGFIVLAKASEREGKKDSDTSITNNKPQEQTTPTKLNFLTPNDTKIHQEDSKAFVQALKSFTPPLAVTSRVGRSLAELMSVLVRICSQPLQRPPRRGLGGLNGSYVPVSEDAITVGLKMTDLLKDSLTWEIPVPSDIDDLTDPDLKEWLFSGMTFKMYAVDFCLLLLFDEHGNSFHLMLHCFNERGVLDALASSFQSALTCLDKFQAESNPCADYAVTSDFLEAWLNLSEKLIDTSCILDSTHTLPIPPPSQSGGKRLTHNPLFDPLMFIIKTQKAILPCVSKLWPPVNIRSIMPQVVTHLMNTIVHYYNSEKVINGKLNELNKGNESSSSGATASQTLSTTVPSAVVPPRVDPLCLQQLMDMGFTRDHSEEALLQNRGNLAASMDWLLTNPPSAISQPQALSEDELLAQAIAMSLEQHDSNTDTKKHPVTTSTSDKAGKPSTSKPVEDTEMDEDGSPISEKTLNDLSEQLLDCMLNQVPYVRDTVYSSCDLLVALIKRNGPAWRDRALLAVKEKALQTMVCLCDSISDGSYDIKGGVLDPDSHYIWLLTILLKELPLACGPIMCQTNLLQACIDLLVLTQRKLPVMKREEESRTNPMWLGPLLLMLELWIGIGRLSMLSTPIPKGHVPVWLWFDNSNSRWCYYPGEVANQIETAYQNNEEAHKVSTGRQRYTIQFSTMMQMNVDSGTQRPVLRLEVPKKDKQQKTESVDDSTNSVIKKEVPSWYCPLSEEQAVLVVIHCTHLLSIPLEPDTLHANMRLLLSLTRDPKLAHVFMSERGPHALLSLTHKSSFYGFSSLSSLLFRHVLEDNSLLGYCMDSIIRGVVMGNLNDPKEIKVHNKRDFDFVLRRLAPCVCRDQELFMKTARESMQLVNEPTPLADYSIQARLHPVILKYVPPLKREPLLLSSVQTQLLTMLVDHLCNAGFMEDGLLAQQTTTATPVGKIDEDTSDSTVLGLRYRLQGSQVRRGSYRRQVTGNDDDDETQSEDMVLDVDPVSDTRQTGLTGGTQEESSRKDQSSVKDAEKEKDATSKSKDSQPMFTQSSVLRLLAEIIESYPICAKTILESSREIKVKNTVNNKDTKEVSILALILDYLLPASYIQGSSATQVAKLARVFLQTLASTALPNDALTLFITEFKASFSRALSLPESLIKHQRIRAIASLLGQIVEPQTQTGFSSRSTINPTQFVRMLIRRGFITDLSKAIHSLDLSSTLLTTTINTILKPLECLTKIVTQFLAAQKKSQSTASSLPGPNAATTSGGPQFFSPPDPLLPPRTQQNQESENATATTPNNNNNTTASNSTATSMDVMLSETQPDTSAAQFGNESMAADISLIPLATEDDHTIDTPAMEDTRPDSSSNVLDEAISIAHQLGIRAREILGGRERGGGNTGSNEDDMDIQEIVDELLERSPGGSGIGPDALIQDDHQDVTISGSDLSEGSINDEDLDNYNSAGEEIDEDDYDESHHNLTPKPNESLEDDLQDTSDSQLSAEMNEDHDHSLDHEDVDGDHNNPDNDDYLSTDDDSNEDDDSMMMEDIDEVVDDNEGDVSNEHRDDDTFDLEEEEEEEDVHDEDDDDEDEGEDGDGGDDHFAVDLDEMDYDDYIHIDMTRDIDPLDSNPYLGGFHSLLSRAYHIRGPSSVEILLPSSTNTLPQYHPLLGRYPDHTPSNEENSVLGRGATPADIQRSNIVQQLLTNISTSVGTDEVLSFNVGGSNPRQTNIVRAPDPSEPPYNTGKGEDTTESTSIPNNLSRWREESVALDGSTAFLCVANIRSSLLDTLLNHFKKHQALKKSADEAAKKSKEPEKTPTQSTTVSAPNPSDETTPSTATPRNEPSVDQLRAVADILSQMGGGGSSGGSRPVPDITGTPPTTQEPTLTTENITGDVRMEEETATTSSQEGVAVGVSSSSSNVSQTPVDVGATPQPIDSMPDLSTFDGTADSARSILSRLNPGDPLYTFLSAVAGGPTPPLPEGSSDHTPPALPPPSSATPRPPVINMFFIPSNPQQTSSSAITAESTITVNGQPIPLTPVTSSTISPSSSQSSNTTTSQSSLTSTFTSSQSGLTCSTSTTSTASEPQIPEGIDPTFLAALPDSIRQEVVAQYEREQNQSSTTSTGARLTGTTATTASGGGATGSNNEINPEILAALPPDIQEEVLQQQRLEEARRTTSTADPSQQVDPTSFIASLTPDLRRTILSDMDDTQIAQLPDDIATEARTLRQERDERSRQLLALQQARYESHLIDARPHPIQISHHHHPIGVLPGGQRIHGYTIFGVPGDGTGHDRFGLFPPPHPLFTHTCKAPSTGDLTGKQILDHEGLACLLVLLFLDQSNIHFNRLFRIFRSLSQHVPSRTWLITSLLSILKRANAHTCPFPNQPPSGTHPHWLNMTVNAALGSHVSVFNFPSSSGKHQSLSDVTIHPHASVSICSNILELIIFLARQFPATFLPPELAPKDKQPSDPSLNVPNNFWQILFRLDSSSRKGKGSVKSSPHPDPPSKEQALSNIFSQSPIGELMKFFDHPIVQGSVNLIDKLLRVLSVISGAIPKQGLVKSTNKDIKETTNTTNTTGNDDGGGGVKEESLDTTAVEELKGPTTLLDPSRGYSSGVLEASETPLGPVRIVPSCYPSSVVSVSLLNSVIDLLTSGKCTEDCLDDATNLLINLSRCSTDTREAILLVLLDGVRKIGRILSDQISVLLVDLRNNMATLSASSYSRQSSLEESTPTNTVPSLGTTEGVVLPTVQGRGPVTDHSQDLHLSCMEPLVCKGSQQSFFLRLLKVVCQLRESSHFASTMTSRRAESSLSISSIPTLRSPQPLITDGNQTTPTNQTPTQDTANARPDVTSSPYTASLSIQLELEELWSSLSDCLDALADTYDPHAVLVLQPTVESFFLVHADHNEEVRSTSKDKRSGSRSRRLPSFHTISDSESNIGSPAMFDTFSPAPVTPGPNEGESSDPFANLPPDTARFLEFAERHRTVLNQILRQSTVPLSEGPFAVLVNHTRLLDFDVKRRYFRQELEQLDEGLRRDDVVIHVRRDHVFEDSYRELYRRSPDELKGNLYITFEGEEGQDAGGLLREWYLIIAREMFNPNYALFKTPGDRATYMPNPVSYINRDHLSYFKFVGRIIAKAIYDNKLLDCYFTRSFYKHILGKPVHYTDMESEDDAFYRSMVFLLNHELDEFGTELTFSTEIEEFGETKLQDLKPNGREIPVTETNKKEYVQLVCQMKMTGSIRKQIKSFLEGFYEVIPKPLISIFNEQELELLISGLPNFDIDDLKSNTEYHKYTETSLQIQWFWRALRSYSQADRARFLQFVTGTSKVPLQGFVALEGMNGIQKFQIHRDDRSTDRLPAAHTCFNHLDLPPYETYDKLNQMLLTAIRECPEGFGFA